MFFYARRRRDSFLFTIIINFVNIEIWSELWFIFDLVMQCINSSCNFFVMKIRSIVLWEWRVFQIIMFEKKWIWIAFVERRSKADLSRHVELILSRRFIKNDADWSFLIKRASRRRLNSFWQSLWWLTRYASCKSWMRHYKHCAHWFIYYSSSWYESCIRRQRRNSSISDRRVIECWHKNKFSRFSCLRKADESRC
jgi:hypothetical protein